MRTIHLLNLSIINQTLMRFWLFIIVSCMNGWKWILSIILWKYFSGVISYSLQVVYRNHHYTLTPKKRRDWKRQCWRHRVIDLIDDNRRSLEDGIIWVKYWQMRRIKLHSHIDYCWHCMSCVFNFAKNYRLLPFNRYLFMYLHIRWNFFQYRSLWCFASLTLPIVSES